MKILPFKPSENVSVGVELEFQIINPKNYDLISRAKDFIRNIQMSEFSKFIKPEITQGMIEINSSVHHSLDEMYNELIAMREFLLKHSEQLHVNICGGGTHPFRKWKLNKIFPSQRFKNLSKQYQYLSKRSTVFGQHIHIGCKSSEDAIYLTHALTRYVPHFIALSASSPFYQGVDTRFCSSRSNVFSSFPTSGVMPYLLNWTEFSEYFYKMRKLGIIHSMKDFYWDIRPKPEYGTVEIRVCDTPLTIKKAVLLAAYIQAVAHYLLQTKALNLSHDFYYVYSNNRFQASRYGFEGVIIKPDNLTAVNIGEDILTTIKAIEKNANKLGTMGFMLQLMDIVKNKQNDALWLRDIYKSTGDLPSVVHEQCLVWKQEI